MSEPQTALREAVRDVRVEHRPNEWDSCVACRRVWPCSAELLAELVETRAAIEAGGVTPPETAESTIEAVSRGRVPLVFEYPLDVERLARAINGGDADGLDDRAEWYTTPRQMAEEVARLYSLLSESTQGEGPDTLTRSVDELWEP